MAFTATVVNKDMVSGQLVVTLEYTDGTYTFREAMMSRGDQSGDWIAEGVKRRLAELDGVKALDAKIAAGPVVVSPVVVEPSEPSDRDQYKAKLDLFNGWLNALRQGLTTTDRQSFVDLRQWLRDNWQDEYVELFL